MDAASIIDRLERCMGFRTDAALAEYLGISSPVLSNWKRRGIADYGVIFDRCPDLDLNYVIYGRPLGEPGLTDEIGRLRARVAELERDRAAFLDLIQKLAVR